MTPTPGPWAYDGITVHAPALDGAVVRRVDGTDVPRGLIALVYAPSGDGSRDCNGHLIAASPVLIETLHAVWRLVETLDIGIAEKAAIRDLVWPALDEARGPYPRVGTP